MQTAGLIALSRQSALERSIDAIAQNVANMNTAGYKSQHIRFREFIEEPDPSAPVGRKIDYVIDQGMVPDFEQGAFESTGATYDLALRGKGFFAIQTPNGERYTRNGHFTLDVNGQLVTGDGQPVLGTNGQPINIGRTITNISIAQDGTITGTTPPATAPTQIGQLRVVTFTDPQKLQRQDASLFSAYPTIPPQIDQIPQVVQGMIEKSNVQAVVEMTRLISAQRSYDAARTLSDTTSQLSQTAIQRLGQRAA